MDLQVCRWVYISLSICLLYLWILIDSCVVSGTHMHLHGFDRFILFLTDLKRILVTRGLGCLAACGSLWSLAWVPKEYRPQSLGLTGWQDGDCLVSWMAGWSGGWLAGWAAFCDLARLRSRSRLGFTVVSLLLTQLSDLFVSPYSSHTGSGSQLGERGD